MAVTTQEVILVYKSDTSDVVKNVNKAKQSIDKTSDSTEVLTNQLDKMTGGAISGFKSAAQGTKSFITGLKLTRAAIIGTGIGALVIGVVALVQAFGKTEEGARRLKKAFQPIAAIIDVLQVKVSALGGAFFKLFSGDFKGAADDFNKALGATNDEYQKQIELYDELVDREFALQDARIKQTVQTAKTRAEIKELNLVAEDLTKTTAEREAAAARAGELERNLFEERKRLAEEELAIAQARLKSSRTTTEDREKVAQLEAEIFQLAQESLELQTTLNNKLNTIRAEGLRIQQEEYALQLERLDKTNEALQAEVVLVTEINNQQERGLMMRQNAETVATGIVISEAEKRKQARRDEFENTIDLLEDEGVVRLQLAQASFAALSALNQAFSGEGEQEARKAFNRNKALSLATAIAQTAQGIITQLASPKDVVTGSNFIKAAIVAATGAAQVANISKTKYQAAGGGGGQTQTNVPTPGSGGGGGTTIGAPSLDLGFLGAGAGQDQPIRAYVLAENVSNSQQANQKIKDQTLIG
jgi:chromosome segregation ATPase